MKINLRPEDEAKARDIAGYDKEFYTSDPDPIVAKMYGDIIDWAREQTAK